MFGIETRIVLALTLVAAAAPAQPPPRQRGPRIAGDGIWMRNAVLAESPAFDPCNAHQPENGQYHYHDNPVCLRLQLSDNIEKSGRAYHEKAGPWKHSPILGWAYDGYPIYGPYGYSDPKNPSSVVRRIASSFRLRQMRERHTLAAWSATLHGTPAELREAQFGPDVSPRYPLGWYVEDFEFAAGSGDLDIYNGRFTVTPEFPQGTYAYFVTIDAVGKPAFPYVLGRQYFGSVERPRRGPVEESGLSQYFPARGDQSKTGDPRLTSWMTATSKENARVVSGYEPDAGARETWPGQDAPVHADIGAVRFSAQWVYASGSGLASHVMGPWLDPRSPDGVFPNWPYEQEFTDRFPRHPQEAEAKVVNRLGPLGRWVNGVALFNMLDGASYSSRMNRDVHGGPPRPPRPPESE